MRKFINKIIVLSLLSTVVISCADYDRTDVVPAIFVNHPSLEMFVGDEIQLTVNPKEDGLTYVWENENNDVVSISNNGLVKALGPGTSDITVRKGDIYTIVSVVVSVKIPLTDIELSMYEVNLTLGASASIAVTSVPDNANSIPNTDFSWKSDDESIAIVTAGGVITGMKLGDTYVHYQKGSFSRTVAVSVAYTFPFKGPHIFSKETPLLLPCRDFDFGGEGYAYHDASSGNSGGSSYRADNGDSKSPDVDIEGGLGIGYTDAGEWLLYTVSVQDAGTYAFQLNCTGYGGSLHIEVDDQDVTGQVPIPSNDSWGNFRWYPEDYSIEIPVTEGKHRIKFYINESGFNIMDMKFTFLR